VNRIAELGLALALERSDREAPLPVKLPSTLATVPANPADGVSLDAAATVPKLD
jgi:hypothetical protein